MHCTQVSPLNLPPPYSSTQIPTAEQVLDLDLSVSIWNSSRSFHFLTSHFLKALYDSSYYYIFRGAQFTL